MPLLRHWLGVSSLSPLWNNVCSVLVSVVYVRLILETFRRRQLVQWTPQSSQKLVHMASASCILFWPLFDTAHWSWRLNVLVPAVMAVRLLYKGAILRDPDDEDVVIMSRSSSPSELLYGPLQFTLVMIWVGWYRFMREEACVIMAALGIGDGLASLIGQRYGRHFFRMPLGRMKTLEGTMFCFLGSVWGCYWYPYIMGLTIFPLRIILAYSGIAAVVEASSPANADNILIPVVIHVLIHRVQQWLPP